MNRLADVELQLVMQGLAAQEILALARCSRYLLHAADAPFAWQHTRLCLNATPGPPPIALPRRIIGWCRALLQSRHSLKEPPRLLRHAKVKIRSIAQVNEHLAILATAARMPDLVLYELDMSNGGQFHHIHLSLVIGSPSMQQLRVLCMRSGTQCYAVVQNAIIKLPHLHTLRLQTSSDVTGVPTASYLEFLSHVPALTSLHIHDTFTAVQSPSQLTHVAACSKLINLSVVWPSLYGSSWSNFFTHHHTQQLRSLKLDKFYVKGLLAIYSGGVWLSTRIHATQQDLLAAFTGMRHLHTLHLARCEWIDLMLPALAHAPVLCQLIIEPDRTNHHPENDTTTAPSTLMLAELLVSAPHLHCALVLSSPRRSSVLERCLRERFEVAVASAFLSAERFTIQSDLR